MDVKDFVSIRAAAAVAALALCPPDVEDDCSPESVSYVPFAEDGSYLTVAKRVPFEPIHVSARAYDKDLVQKITFGAIKTYRGDALDLVNTIVDYQNEN